MLGVLGLGCAGSSDTAVRDPGTAAGGSAADGQQPEAGSTGDSAGNGSGGGSAGGAGQTGGQSSGAGGSAASGSGGAERDAGSSGQGGADAGHAQDAGGDAPTTVYRVTELTLRDPHFFLDTTDITDEPFLGTSVNGSLIPGGFTMDYDGDGFVDVSILALLTPADPAAESLSFEMVDGHCRASDPTKCEPHPQPGLHATWTAHTQQSGACLEPIAGTTSGFTPAPTSPQGPCFVTDDERDLTINLGGVNVALTAAKVAARFDGNPPARLVDGLLVGFVTQQKAMQALLPDYLPLLAGTPLSDYLRAEDRDQAQSPNGEDGYFVYLNFVAEPVSYDAP